MVRIILLVQDEIECTRLSQYLMVQYQVKIYGTYALVSDFILKQPIVRADIVFITFDLLYHMDYDRITFMKEVKVYGKLVVVLQDGEDYKFIEFKELGNMRGTYSWEEFVLKNSPSKLETKRDRRICCFGNFMVLRENNIIHPKWRTKKVKELFAYLIGRYDRVVSKDEILRLLYSMDDKNKSLNQLYVTMSYLKKQLHDLEIGLDEFIIYPDYTIHVAPGVCDYVDFDRFISKCTNIDENNIELAEDMIALYHHMYLEEEDYMWAYDIREYLDKRYEEILIKMAGYYRIHGFYAECERVLVRFIEHNPLSVLAYNELLNLYKITKKDMYYKKVYNQYENMLTLEFSDKPEMIYQEHYKKLKEKVKIQ